MKNVWIKKENEENFKWIKDDNKNNKDNIKDKKDKEDKKVIFNEVRVLLHAELSRLKSSFIF